MTDEMKIKLDILSAYMGSPLTEEQKEFASDFTKDTISFSDPGTGKTHTLVAGLIFTQSYHKVPGHLINCMSFTKAAVSEMAGRYEYYCKEKFRITPTVKFNTFHSLTNAILKQAYPLMNVVDGDAKTDIKDMANYLNNEGVQVDPDNDVPKIKKVIRAVNNLNSSLTFHPEAIKRKYEFTQLDMDVNTFQSIRTSWFLRGINSNQITQGDIPLYCLYAIKRKKEVADYWKGKYKIMVVDEFQDLSLLHLHILSIISDTLVVIGDMKQQIYAFNGACPQIVDEYLKLHPNAAVRNLTQSFRCGQAIAEFATKVIKPNDPTIECFKGHDRGSSVELIHRRDMNWKKIAEDIETDIRLHGRAHSRDVMFLYRNNASAIPIIEELYRKGIPFRCSRYKKIMDIPIFESLSKLCQAAWQPNDVGAVDKALRLFPEFRNLKFHETVPVISSMRSSGCDLFSLHYKYREDSSKELLSAMLCARKAILDGKSAGVVYMKVLPAYEQYIFRSEWWKIDNDKEFYFNLVAPICNNKDYPTMYNEELDKEMKNRQYINGGAGIRCYTMHSAKGLEADDVYILDCDEGIVPNRSVLSNKTKAGCVYDAATDIRSERNLLYVAITRAKDNVVITYSSDEPARLITNPDDAEYSDYDDTYYSETTNYDDAGEFFRLFNLGD